MRLIFSAFLGLSLLAACAEPAPKYTGPVKALPAYFWDIFNRGVVADAIATECRSIRFNDPTFDADLERTIYKLYADNYTENDIGYGIDHPDEAATQKIIFDYVEDNGIILSNAETWCRAGRNEIARKTPIGRYLKAR